MICRTLYLFALMAAASGAGWFAGIVVARPVAGPAPYRWEPLEADLEPDREWKLPPDELAPDELIILAQAGDVADWGHGLIDVPAAWRVTKGEGAFVAIIDTGGDAGHRDLKDHIVYGKDFTNSRSGWSDVNGHGTHCAGVVAAAENEMGMVGVAPKAKILILKALGDNGSGMSSGIAAAIDEAINWRGANGERCQVVSMSLGSDAPDARILAACKRAREAGLILIAAAGNSGPRENTAGYPGRFPECLCVGALDRDAKVAQFSSRGGALYVAAPGVNVRSCYPGDRFATMSGTSMATPYVAGVAALYVSHAKASGVKWSADEFARLIAKTSRDLAPAGRDTATGHGLIQPAKLLAELAAPKQPEPPVMPPPKNPNEPPAADRIEIVPPPGFSVGGKPITKIILELGSVKP